VSVAAPEGASPHDNKQKPASRACTAGGGPGHSPTFTKRRLYLMRFMARPLGSFFLSWASTLGVWPRTLPARAKEPWTFPVDRGGATQRRPASAPAPGS